MDASAWYPLLPRALSRRSDATANPLPGDIVPHETLHCPVVVMTSTSAVDWMPIWIPQEAPAMVRKLGPYQLPLWGSLLRSRPSP
jgi:hypothetical protein